MSRKSKQTKTKAPAQKPKSSTTKPPTNSSGRKRKQASMSDAHCTLLDPTYRNAKCPFRVQYEQPLPPMRANPNSVQGPTGRNSFAIVIFPQYFTDPTAMADNTTMGVSAYMWASNGLPTVNPTFGTNWATDPFVSTTANQIYAIKCPGLDTITSANIEGFRTWASCFKIINAVAASSMAGQIAVVYDLTAEQILEGGAGDTHISIADIFNMARPEDTKRLDAEHMFCYAPEEPDAIIRKFRDHPISVTRAGTSYTPFVASREELRASKAIVIAVRSSSATVMDSITLSQVSRVEPSYGAGSGFVKALPVYSPKGPDDHTQELSKKNPSWRSLGNKLLKTGLKVAEDNLPALLQRMILGSVLL